MPRTNLVSFSLQDQFNGTHSSDFPADQILVVIGGDKDGSAFTGDIARALITELEARGADDLIKSGVRWLPVADLRIVPFFLRWAIKSFLPSKPEETVALDWTGVFGTSYDWISGRANVMIFGKGPERRVLFSKSMVRMDEEDKRTMVSIILGY